MTLRIALLAFLALASLRAQCISVSGERILAADMARAVPAFGAVAPELVLGFAPSPGTRRVYAAAEMARLGKRYGLALEPGAEACFARPLETLTPDRIAAALQKVMPAAHIEIVDFSRQPIPPGELRFPPSGLQVDPSSRAPRLWRGAVCAPGRDDFPLWAKVRVAVTGTRVVATAALIPGRPIERAQLHVESYQGPPGLPDLAEVVGRAPRRYIPAGAVIEGSWLDAPAQVYRGESVRVEVDSGLARVLLEGQAQSSGRRGEVIAVRNPANGKILHATVTDRGRVVVAAGPLARIGTERTGR